MFACLKILIETKSIQKEINQLSGKLERIFNAADELIFKVIHISKSNFNLTVQKYFTTLIMGKRTPKKTRPTRKSTSFL